MRRILLWNLFLLLAVLMGAGPGWAQPSQGPPAARLDERKYRAIYGRPPPPPGEEKAKEGEAEATQEPQPRYRFGNDPLLNPPGRRRTSAAPPAASALDGGTAAPSYPRAPSRPPGLSYSNDLPAAVGSPALPQREIRVLVIDDQGQPVPLARVSLSTREQPFFREGLTGDQGVFITSVPCYLPGGRSMLAHTLRVGNSSDSQERLLVTRRGSCGVVNKVTVVLADPDRLNKMLRRYRERQERYDLEEKEQKAKEAKELELLPGRGKAAPGGRK